jgi:hypothetical protein
MILKLEEVVRPFGRTHEYINSERIFRVALLRKRIKIYYNANPFAYIYVGKTEHNIKQLKKWDKNIGWE